MWCVCDKLFKKGEYFVDKKLKQANYALEHELFSIFLFFLNLKLNISTKVILLSKTFIFFFFLIILVFF